MNYCYWKIVAYSEMNSVSFKQTIFLVVVDNTELDYIKEL